MNPQERPPARRASSRAAAALRLAACVLLFAAAALQRNGRLFGCELRPAPAEDAPAADGDERIVDSTGLAPGVLGYGGPVPVRVVVSREGRVRRVDPLPNDETPMFFETLAEAGLWHAWDGLPAAVASTARVEAVTSATYSSEAAIANVRAALASMAPTPPQPAPRDLRPTPKQAAATLVLLAAAVLPLFVRSRRYRLAQQALDVAVLGLWSGLFLSHARLLGWAGAGLPRDPWDAAGALLLLATALLHPLFGRAGHYCAHVCPFGAAQELAARLPVPKRNVPPALARRLDAARRALWAALTVCLAAGLGARWTDWELFSAFAFRAASGAVVALALATVALSVFVPVPTADFSALPARC